MEWLRTPKSKWYQADWGRKRELEVRLMCWWFSCLSPHLCILVLVPRHLNPGTAQVMWMESTPFLLRGVGRRAPITQRMGEIPCIFSSSPQTWKWNLVESRVTSLARQASEILRKTNPSLNPNCCLRSSWGSHCFSLPLPSRHLSLAANPMVGNAQHSRETKTLDF